MREGDLFQDDFVKGSSLKSVPKEKHKTHDQLLDCYFFHNFHQCIASENICSFIFFKLHITGTGSHSKQNFVHIHIYKKKKKWICE